jgi:hypothetical protein
MVEKLQSPHEMRLALTCIYNFAILFAILTSSTAQAAGGVCGLMMPPPREQRFALDPANLSENHTKIINYAVEKSLPVFGVEIAAGTVPVILLNKNTISSWSWLLEQTIGIANSMNPENPANHGYARLPGEIYVNQARPFSRPYNLYDGKPPTGALMDLYSPGNAGPNAAAGTGYRFKSMADMFERRTQDSTEFVDLAYNVSQGDQVRFWLYHAAKRTGLVRIQYYYDTPQNYWITQQRRTLQRDGSFFGNIELGGFEHCNNSRCGEVADVQVIEMRGRLSGLLNRDTNEVFHTSEAKRFLDDAKKDLLWRDWRNAETYDPDFLNTPHYLGLMQYFFREGLSHEQKVDALSYLLAVNIFEEAFTLKNRLKIEEDIESQYGNPNITAIFIYSDNPDNVARFKRGNITLSSAPSFEGNNGFSTRYFRVRRF